MNLNDKQLKFVDEWIKDVMHINVDYELINESVEIGYREPVIFIKFKDEWGNEYIDSTGLTKNMLDVMTSEADSVQSWISKL